MTLLIFMYIYVSYMIWVLLEYVYRKWAILYEWLILNTRRSRYLTCFPILAFSFQFYDFPAVLVTGAFFYGFKDKNVHVDFHDLWALMIRFEAEKLINCMQGWRKYFRSSYVYKKLLWSCCYFMQTLLCLFLMLHAQFKSFNEIFCDIFSCLVISDVNFYYIKYSNSLNKHCE